MLLDTVELLSFFEVDPESGLEVLILVLPKVETLELDKFDELETL
jgi:hypothetical protein